jgi:CRISPR/Cas system-associated exonuclease Cas4 (RecB family)
MVRVEEDSVLKRLFLEKLREHYSSHKDGFFVTDFVYCLRKSFWRRVRPKPFSEQQLGYFIDGSRRHESLQFLSGLQCEVSFEKHGVRGRLDMLDAEPIEFKSTRSRSGGAIPLHYLKQCAYYCVLTGKSTCTLITQHIIEGRLSFQKLTFSAEELLAYERELCEGRRLLEEALAKQDCSCLPPGEPWQCRSCEYNEECGE